MWGIVPAAGLGRRTQPLAFSKELLPAGSRRGGSARGVKAGEAFVDVGTLTGYREAVRLLAGEPAATQPAAGQ